MRAIPGAPCSTASERTQQLLSGRRLPWVRALQIIIPVVRALECAHGHDIVHRDLKPSNIFVTDSGAIKVLDFGIAKVLPAHRDRDDAPDPGDDDEPVAPANRPAVTRDGALVGTLPYMSPEQWGQDGIDHRCDLWAVGIILYSAVVGHHPLAPYRTRQELRIIADLQRPMPSARDVRVPMPGELAEIIDWCLRKRKDERVATARELCDALEALLPDRRCRELRTGESPYAGLAAFQEADANRFFGRSEEIAAVFTRLEHQPLVAVAGPSGVGKSSFVRAGVIPGLKSSGEPWDAFVLRPGRRPLASLSAILVSLLTEESDHSMDDELSRNDEVLVRLGTEPGYMGAVLRARARRRGRRVVVFVDQFEELFTLTEDDDERRAFVACLCGTADDAASPLRVLMAIRSDFLDRAADDARLATELTRGLFFLSPPDRSTLREGLLRPAEMVGFRFESEESVEHMLDALETVTGALPLLQFAASQLWLARDIARGLLTDQSYAEIGGIAGALASHADAVIEGMSTGERVLARAILLRLVTPARTRAIAESDELAGLSERPEELERVLSLLVDARLLVIHAGQGDDDGRELESRDPATGERDPRSARRSVELVHESLIHGWPRLRHWLDESQEDLEFLTRLRLATRQWQASGRSEGTLWRGEWARDAELFHVRYRGSLPRGERHYLDAVLALANRSARRRRHILGGVAVMVVAVAAAMTYLAWSESAARHRADEQANRAKQETERAQREAARVLDATRVTVVRESDLDPTTAAAILGEVGDPTANPYYDAVATTVLNDDLAVAVLHGHADGVVQTVFSPDSSRVLTLSRDGRLRIWRVSDRRVEKIVGGDGLVLRHARFSPDSQRVLARGSDHRVRVWTIAGSASPAILAHEPGEHLDEADFIPDGRVLTRTRAGVIRSWPADGQGPATRIDIQAPVRGGIDISPDGTRLAFPGGDSTARVVATDGGDELVVLDGHEGVVMKVTFSADGSRILVHVTDGTVWVWNADGSGKAKVLREATGMIGVATFSHDSARVLTLSRSAGLKLWPVTGEQPPITVAGPDVAIVSAYFTPDGRRIFGLQSKDSMVLWDASGTGEPVYLPGDRGSYLSLRFNSDSTLVATLSQEGVVRVWRTDGLGSPRLPGGQSFGVLAMAFSPDGRYLITGSEDGVARIWPAERRGSLIGHRGAVWSATFDPGGDRIVTASADGTARVWSVASQEPAIVLDGRDDGRDDGASDRLTAATFSPDGTRIATASSRGVVLIWRADGAGEPVVLGGPRQGRDAQVLAMRFSPDGSRVLVATSDGRVRLWPVDGSAEPGIFDLEGGLVLATVSQDFSRIAVKTGSGTAVRVWRTDGSGDVTTIASRAPAASMALSPDGSRLAIGATDRGAEIWDIDREGRAADRPLVLPGHGNQPCIGISFSPDGARVVTASWDDIARVWRTDRVAPPLVLRGHRGAIRRAIFSPDGQRVLTVSDDSTARIWRSDGSGQPVVIKHDKAIRDGRFSRDGQRVVTASSDGTARVSRVPRSRDIPAALRRASNDCVPVATRRRLLGVSEETAIRDHADCVRASGRE